MDVAELILSCRKGDLEKICNLVEIKDVDVNVKDEWDSSPLYYACLCGHLLVVKYLIEVGARCEANTFDGERCLYGALTNEIKRLLLQQSMITSHTIRRNAYQEFLRRLFESGEGSDVSFGLSEETFKLHRCILCARSSYFAVAFSTKWLNKDKISLNKSLIDASVFNAVMKYVYTGMFECSFDQVGKCLALAKNCSLPLFQQKLEKAVQKAKSFQVEKQGRVLVTRVVIEPHESDTNASVESNLLELAQSTLPPSSRVWPTEMPFSQTPLPPLVDVCFVVNEHSFMCHKIFFSARSEYFEALFKYHLIEMQPKEVPTIRLGGDVSKDIFEAVVLYLYANQFSISQDNVCDLLMAANMYLLPGLVRQCGVFMAKRLTIENVIDVHQIARTYNLPRLEDCCVAFMAKHFGHIADEESFRNLIVTDASAIQRREETDSITVIDELRYHISSHLKTVSDIEEAKSKLTYLEKILEDLDIDV